MSSIATLLQSVLKPLLSGAEASLEAVAPKVLAAAQGANVSAISVVANVATNAISKLTPAESSVIGPLFDFAFATYAPEIVTALGGEEQALVNATLARAQQIVAAL